MNGYYSVFDPDGKKIADCGIERDAVNLMHTRNKYWDGHYFTFNPLPGDIIDVSNGKQLPTRDIVVNMDGGVGGSWQEVEYVEIKGQKLELQQSNYLKQTMTVDTVKYLDFVKGVTSDPSLDWPVLAARLSELEVTDDCNVSQLLTAALGLTAESGEFTEVVKKIFLQGKPYTEENVFHMKRELGDICWYLAQACMALDTTFDEVIEMNVEKLKARYPGGEFDVHKSENRKEGDL